MAQSQIQLGKNGVTKNFIISLKNQFKNHRQVRISVLKNAGENGIRDKNEVLELTDEILKSLNMDCNRYSSKIIGFTLIVNKHRKVV